MIDYYDENKWGEQILTKDELFDREKISLQLLRKYAKVTGSFLDVGCGIGFFLRHFSETFPRNDLYGVDYSSYNIQKAKKTGAVIKKCDLNVGIPFKDKSFDTLYIAEVIEHMFDPDKVFEECSRVLKKEGVLVVTTPNLCAWYNRLLVTLGIQPIFYESSTKDPKNGSGPLMARLKQGKIPVGHIRIFTLRALTDQLKRSGFVIKEIKGAHFEPLPKPIRLIDDIVKLYPRLASGFVVVAKKK